MNPHISATDRRSLMGAGFPRQTIYKWITKGIIPRPGNRNLIARIIGRDPWAKKNKRGNNDKE